MNFNAVISGLFLLFFATPAMAYLDPGSGSAIMSAIIGIVVSVGIVIKTYWYKIKSFFTKSKNQ